MPRTQRSGTTKASRANTDSVDTLALAESLRDVVGRFVRTVRNHSGTQSTAQSETLAFLERSGPISIAALAEARGVKHQSMRLVVAKLEASGVLARQSDPDDRRGFLISVTDQGRTEMAADRSARTSWLADALVSKMSTRELAILADAVLLIDRLTDRAEPQAPSDPEVS